LSVTPTPAENDATDASGKGLPLPASNHENASASNAPQMDPDLTAVLDAWPTLAEPIKAGIVAMVRAARGGS
jgi:hypothetical protein